MKILTLLLLLILSSEAFGFGRKAASVPLLDTVTASSLVDGDATGLSEGCGQQPSPLGMFCRLTEGDVAPKSIFLIGPPSDCDRAACVFVKVYNEQGTLVFGNSIPKGQTRIEVPWATLLGRPTVQIGDRGIWTFNTTVYFKNPDGKEQNSTSQGDIILRVTRKGYLPLQAVADDPSFVWTWTEGGYLYRMTSGLRAYVGKVN